MKRPPTRMGASTRVPSQAKATAPSGVSEFEPYFRGFNVLTDPEFENFRDNSGGWYWPDRIDDTGESRFTVPYLDTSCPSFLLWPNQTCAEKLLVGWAQTSGPYILEEDDPDNPPPPPPEPDPDPPPAPDLTPPAVPTGLQATSGNMQVLLDWNNNVESDLAGYRVYQATSSSGPFVQVASRAVSDYVVLSLTNGTQYWFAVSAVDTTGNPSALSAAVSSTPAAPPGGDVTPPANPTNLTATDNEDRQVTLNWDNSPASDFSFFRVKRATVSGGPYSLVATRTASDFISTGLTNGTTYYYVVTAVDTSGNESGNSNEADGTPNFVAPPPPPDPPPPGSGGDGFPTYADRALTINPGDDIDTKIQSVPVGTIIGFAAGFHDVFTSGAMFTPRTGERLVGQTDSNGVPLAIIRGNWNQSQSGTGLASPFSAYNTDVQFLRLDVRQFAPALQQAVINGGTRWRIHKCYVHDNKTGGVRVGQSATLFQCKIYRNMQIGMITVNTNTGATVDGCEFFENNLHNWVDWRWEGGAMKFIGFGGFKPQNMIVRNCWFHHNQGPGVWYDFAGSGGLIENNLCEHNIGPGLFYEITEGAGTIRGNTCRFNGDSAELYFSNSRGVSGNPVIVENNIIENTPGTTNTTHAGIWCSDAPTRPIRLGHVTIRGNRVTRRVISGKANVACGTFGDSITPPGITINDNDYFVQTNVQWQWLGTGRTWTAWNGLGFDTVGSRTII